MILNMLRKHYYNLRERKKATYLRNLVENGLVLGKNIHIMEGFFFDPSHCYLISIGDNCTLAPNVRLIAHDASMKNYLGYTRVGKINIGSNCFLGDSVIVLPKVSIGDGSIIASGSVVTKDIPPNSIAAGNPCRVIGTQEEYIYKHKKGIESRRVPYSELEQTQLTRAQREEILRFLGSEIGYVR